jgi:hypothetical protein
MIAFRQVLAVILLVASLSTSADCASVSLNGTTVTYSNRAGDQVTLSNFEVATLHDCVIGLLVIQNCSNAFLKIDNCILTRIQNSVSATNFTLIVVRSNVSATFSTLPESASSLYENNQPLINSSITFADSLLTTSFNLIASGEAPSMLSAELPHGNLKLSNCTVTGLLKESGLLGSETFIFVRGRGVGVSVRALSHERGAASRRTSHNRRSGPNGASRPYSFPHRRDCSRCEQLIRLSIPFRTVDHDGLSGDCRHN